MVQISVDLVARVVHEANRVLQAQTGEDVSVSWDEAPDWQKDSAYLGVHEALSGVSSEELHDAWCEHKRNTGWVFGSVKDDVAKTHPCLVPYGDLPVNQKVKDQMFSAIVKAFAESPEVEV